MAVIVGLVLDSAGKSLADVRLTFTGRGGIGKTSTRSLDDGTFRTKPLEAGTYDYLARLEGFADRRDVLADLPGGDKPVELEPFPLFKAAALFGTVTGSGGAPAAGARVSTLEPLRLGPAALDGEGRYALEGLVPGVYRVHVDPPPGFLERPDDEVKVPEGERIEASFELEEAPDAGSLSGRVTDAAGAPAVGATVSALDAQGAVFGPVAVAADGTYSLAGLAPGAYRIEVAPPPGFVVPDPVEVQVAAGADTAAADVMLAAVVAGGVIRGRVSDRAGTGVPGASVATEPAAGGPGGQADTDAAGVYELAGLAPGTYSVRVTAPDPGTYVAASNVRVTLQRATEGIDFAADPLEDYIGRLDDDRFSIESRVSVERAREGATLFSVVTLMFAGADEATDVLGMMRLHDGVQDGAFLDRMKVPRAAPFWVPLTARVTELVRVLSQRRSEVGTLATEARRRFNLGPALGVVADVEFPRLFARYARIGADPLLSLDLHAEAAAGAGADRAQLAHADELLAELKDVILQIVRSLSRYGAAGLHQLNADWAAFETQAMEVLSTLAQHRIDPHNLDSASQWAVLADITGADRTAAIAPYVALARHGRRMLDVAIDVYVRVADDLERFDPAHLRGLFQAGDEPDGFITALIAREATTILRNPLPGW
jgi:hypothetical protein